MNIAIAGDHGGFELKEKIKDYLSKKGYSVKDFGTYSKDAVDYPDFAFLAAASVSRGEYSKGIIIDSTGIASSIVANKVPNIRATACNDIFSAHSSREHNNANILCIGAQIVGQGKALMILEEWLSTEYAGGRHQRRIDKISRIEEKFLKNIWAE